MFYIKVEAKNLTLSLEMDPGLRETIVSDENKIKEILINLIGNAVKFTHQGGITLRCWMEKDPATRKNKDQLLFIEVEDTGIGIAAGDLPKLFQAFEQTSSGAGMAGGTGLGLAICQAHAKLMGGQIEVASTPGQGSRFRVALKVQSGGKIHLPAGRQARRVAGIKPTAPEIKILIVDDNESNRLLLQDLLETVGILTRCAESGLEAIIEVEQWNPDVVLMDLRMPGMDGFEAARRIKSKQSGRDIHILAVTASVIDLDHEKMLTNGMSGFLRKPFKDYSLFMELEKVLGDVFVYESGGEDLRVEAGPEPGAITPNSILAIPHDLIEKMADATMSARLDDLLELIE